VQRELWDGVWRGRLGSGFIRMFGASAQRGKQQSCKEMSLCPLLWSESGVPQISLYAHGSGFVPVIVSRVDVVTLRFTDRFVCPFCIASYRTVSGV
jgi:hypothetical protein